MSLYTVAQRRSLFHRALEGVGDIKRFFGKEEESEVTPGGARYLLAPHVAISKMKESDQRIREIALNHGSAQQSLKQDLIAAKRELQANNLMEANKYLFSFKLALESIVEVATSTKELLTKTASEEEDFLNLSKSGLEEVLAKAEELHHNVLILLFDKLDESRARGNVHDYSRYLGSLINSCEKFIKFYQESYKMYVDPILSREVRLREEEKIKDMVNRLSKVDPRFAELCECGSGKAYGACCGLDMEKIYSIMRRMKASGEYMHVTKDQAIKIYLQEYNRNVQRQAEREAARLAKEEEAKEKARLDEIAIRRERMAPIYEEAFSGKSASAQRVKMFKLILAGN